MAGNPSEEETKFWLKIGLYVAGLGLGILTKLTELLKEPGANWKDVIIYVMPPLSVGFVVLSILYYYGAGWVSLPISVICGKYGKEIWELVYRWGIATLKVFLGGDK